MEAATDPEELYALLQQLVGELKDAHSWPCNYRAENTARTWCPGLEIRRIEKQAVVVEAPADSAAGQAGVKPGTVILAVDGRPVSERLAELRAHVGSFSSKRARTDEVYRRLLDGPKGSVVKLSCRQPGAEKPVEIELRRDCSAFAPPKPPPFVIQRGDFVWSGKHPSGLGYIRILSFSGRMEIADEFDRALEELKDMPGLILDLRDNLGGFGTAQPRIVGRFISQRTKVSVSAVRNGKGHGDFAENATYFEPAGPWPYSRPLALLTNARTGSASDLFTAYLSSTGRPLIVGATTHGNLSGTAVYVTLPCDLAVRLSNGYVGDGHGRIIEGQGTKPTLPVEPTIADVTAGRDTVLERTVEALREKRGG